MSLPFAQFPLIRTTCLDEAAELFRRHTTAARLRLLDRKGRFGWRVNGMSVGALVLSANQWRAAVAGESEAVDDVFTTAFPLTTVRAEGIDAGTHVPVAKDRSTWLVSPSRSGAFRNGAGHRSLQLTIRRADMEAALTSLTGAGNKTPLRFEPRLSLESGVGASLQRLARFAASEAAHEGNPFTSPIVAARFAETVMYSMLLGQPHNHSALLIRSTQSFEPRHVSTAAEYLEAHAGEPVRMADLARVTGVSVRALQISFQKHRACSPTEFLRDRRLVLARTRLLVPGASTVTQIAIDCGFAHLGRFSALYRARFGETPSATHAKSRDVMQGR